MLEPIKRQSIIRAEAISIDNTLRHYFRLAELAQGLSGDITDDKSCKRGHCDKAGQKGGIYRQRHDRAGLCGDRRSKTHRAQLRRRVGFPVHTRVLDTDR